MAHKHKFGYIYISRSGDAPSAEAQDPVRQGWLWRLSLQQAEALQRQCWPAPGLARPQPRSRSGPALQSRVPEPVLPPQRPLRGQGRWRAQVRALLPKLPAPALALAPQRPARVRGRRRMQARAPLQQQRALARAPARSAWR